MEPLDAFDRRLGGLEPRVSCAPHPVAAVRCATALQDGLDERDGSSEPLRVRIGVHTGEAISDDTDFFGEAGAHQ